MSQHFLLTAAARTVSLKQILRMEEAEAWTLFCTIRWPETSGAPVCPQCGCPTCWACPRPNGAPRFRCSACRRDFSPTSGTLFAFHKLEIRDYLAAVVIFCDEVKGKAARRATSTSSTRPPSCSRTRSGKRWPRRSKAYGSAAPGGTLRSTAVTLAATFGPRTGRRTAQTGVWRRTGAAGARSSW
jgi:hypothetical protein